MSLLTLTEARALVKTSLSDPELQAVINREEDEIARLYGAPYVNATTTVSETLPGGGASLFVRRPLMSVKSVTEDAATLAATDYRLWPGQGRLERLPKGAIWGEVITLVYVPQDDNMRRKAVLIDLIRLAVERTALKSESIAGEYSYTAPEWDAERAKALRRLGFIRS
jgi:hypothetical protein